MKKALTILSMALCATVFAQEQEKDSVATKPDRNLPKGNSQYNKGEYAQAEANYRVSQSQAPQKAAASYNLGNAIYRQKQPSEAKTAYLDAIKNAKDKSQKHQAYHNLGNVLMSEKKYSEAAEAYKNALRNNPQDDETRYNYALAKSKIPKQKPPEKDPKSPPPPPKPDPKSQQKPNQGGGNDQKDKNKNQGDGNGNQNKQEKGDKQNGQGQGNNNNQDKQKGPTQGQNKQQNGQPKPQGGTPTQERMKNMLDAMNNEEKKVQDKMNAKKTQGQPKTTDKDW